jgi:hypothetical protein
MSKSTEQKQLESYLSQAQRDMFVEHHHFYVVTQGGLVYMLHDGQTCVQMFDRRQYEYRCVYGCDAGYAVGKYTSMLTQVLFLRSKDWDHLIGASCHEGHPFRGVAGSSLCPPMNREFAEPSVPRGV